MKNLPVYLKDMEKSTTYNSNLNKYLQDNVGQNGLVAPSRTSADITDLSLQKPNGTMWYDEDSNELKVMKNGTVRTVSTS